jgi:hypothetical protein
MELRAKPLLKGILSLAVPALRSTHRPSPDDTSSSLQCYSIFLLHFNHLEQFTGGRLPSVVAELGPGNSIGAGLAAVIAGAGRYVGLDIQDHTSVSDNLRVFDELVDYFRQRKPIPREIGIATQPVDWAFPPSLAINLDRALAKERIDAIRHDIATRSGKIIRFIAPWNARASVEPGSIDWIFSHSVMEHVDKVGEVYRCCAAWLVDDGYMTHEIDYGSHGLTQHWNGHWAVKERLWRLMTGKRPYLINRLPHEAQRELLTAADFELLEDIRVKGPHGLETGDFTTSHASISSEDAETRVAFVVCQRRRRCATSPPGSASVSRSETAGELNPPAPLAARLVEDRETMLGASANIAG